MSANMKVMTHMLGNQRVGQFVDLKPLDTSATVQEAIAKGYVVGKLDLITASVCGVLRSMAAAIAKDGCGRKVDGFVSLQPSVRCKLADNCEPVTKENVVASVRARVLKEGAIDTTGWSITIEGAAGAIDVSVITTGEAMNEVVIGEAIAFNGSGLLLPDDATITWATSDGTTTKTGTIAANKRTCAETRITTAADVLATLTGSGWDGKTIVFTITNGTKKAIKSATLKVAG